MTNVFQLLGPHMLSIFPWKTDFIREHPEYLPKDNAMAFISDNGGDTYNRCHCESLCSNF